MDEINIPELQHQEFAQNLKLRLDILKRVSVLLDGPCNQEDLEQVYGLVQTYETLCNNVCEACYDED